MYLTLLKRELALSIAGFADALAVSALYLLAVGFYMLGQPFGVGISASGAAAALWMAALLALGLTQYRIWERDAEDGTLEQWALLPLALEGVVAVKLLAHWLMGGLPLVVLTPAMIALLGIPLPATLPLLTGTVALTALGGIAGAVSLHFASRQLLTLLLVFPLGVPVLIFGASASLSQESAAFGLSLLLAYTMALCPLAVGVITYLLRIAIRG